MISKIYKDVCELHLALNMRRAQCLTLEIARIMDDECIDILLMQEPYNPKGKFIGFGWRVTRGLRRQIRHCGHGRNNNDHDDQVESSVTFIACVWK